MVLTIPPMQILDISRFYIGIWDITSKEARAKAFAAQIYANYMENPEIPISVTLQMRLVISPFNSA